MLFSKVRFCLAKGKLIREVECAVCKISPAERYDRRLAKRRSGGESADRELRGGSDKRTKRYTLCPGFLRMAFLKIFYPVFKTPYAGVAVVLTICAAVLIVAGLRFRHLWKTEKPVYPSAAAGAPGRAAAEDIQKNFRDFAGQLRREFNEYSGKSKYSIQLVVTANKIIDGFLEKYPAIPETVPGDIIDSIFIDSFEHYFRSANTLFDSYFYVDDDQLRQIKRRLDLLLHDTQNLSSDWEKISARLPDYANSHVHIVRVRQIKKSLLLFGGNINKLKSGNILKEALVIPSLDIKKLPVSAGPK